MSRPWGTSSRGTAHDEVTILGEEDCERGVRASTEHREAVARWRGVVRRWRRPRRCDLGDPVAPPTEARAASTTSSSRWDASAGSKGTAAPGARCCCINCPAPVRTAARSATGLRLRAPWGRESCSSSTRELTMRLVLWSPTASMSRPGASAGVNGGCPIVGERGVRVASAQVGAGRVSTFSDGSPTRRSRRWVCSQRGQVPVGGPRTSCLRGPAERPSGRLRVRHEMHPAGGSHCRVVALRPPGLLRAQAQYLGHHGCSDLGGRACRCAGQAGRCA